MKQTTYYHLILDQSGSMTDCIADTLDSYNGQLKAVQELQVDFPIQEITVGLTCFNEYVSHVYFSQHPRELKPLSRECYNPHGSTALFDAIGKTVRQIQDRQKNNAESNVTNMIVILTDGHENASVCFTLIQIRELIAALEGSGNWTFSYLGATLDAVDIATSLNIRSNNSMSFEKADMQKVFHRVSKSIRMHLEDKGNANSDQSSLQREKE